MRKARPKRTTKKAPTTAKTTHLVELSKGTSPRATDERMLVIPRTKEMMMPAMAKTSELVTQAEPRMRAESSVALLVARACCTMVATGGGRFAAFDTPMPSHVFIACARSTDPGTEEDSTAAAQLQ